MLSHVCCQEYNRVSSIVPATLAGLLAPHLESLAAKLQPGLLVLTWTSLNIDGFLHRYHQVGGRLRDSRSSSS